jgi:hypothetical protein
VISVLITASDDPRPLARLLTALVRAAAEGLVREAAVIGAAGPSRTIADDAGAGLYDDFASALATAKGPWLTGLPLGPGLSPGWMEVLAAHLAREPAEPARLIGGGGALGFGGRPEGWLLPKRLAPSTDALEQDLQRLARRGRRLRILDRRRG